jgi:hypothetical protein
MARTAGPTRRRARAPRAVAAARPGVRGGAIVCRVSENFSLIVMCLFMLASLAFLAQQILAYR